MIGHWSFYYLHGQDSVFMSATFALFALFFQMCFSLHLSYLEQVSDEIPVGFLFDVERNFVGIFPLSADILKMAPGFLLVMNS